MMDKTILKVLVYLLCTGKWTQINKYIDTPTKTKKKRRKSFTGKLHWEYWRYDENVCMVLFSDKDLCDALCMQCEYKKNAHDKQKKVKKKYI